MFASENSHRNRLSEWMGGWTLGELLSISRKRSASLDPVGGLGVWKAHGATPVMAAGGGRVAPLEGRQLPIAPLSVVGGRRPTPLAGRGWEGAWRTTDGQVVAQN